MAYVGSFFAAAGRLSVRFRWAIDQAFMARLAAALARVAKVVSVRDAGSPVTGDEHILVLSVAFGCGHHENEVGIREITDPSR
jgi:hypothetical protein